MPTLLPTAAHGSKLRMAGIDTNQRFSRPACRILQYANICRFIPTTRPACQRHLPSRACGDGCILIHLANNTLQTCQRLLQAQLILLPSVAHIHQDGNPSRCLPVYLEDCRMSADNCSHANRRALLPQACQHQPAFQRRPDSSPMLLACCAPVAADDSDCPAHISRATPGR